MTVNNMKPERQMIFKEHQEDPDMRRGWNARADEDPLYYILTAAKYRDIEEFNKAGIESADFVMKEIQPFIHGHNAVLDIGCGIGRVLKYVAPNFTDAWGVDVSDRYLELSKDFLKGSPNTATVLNTGYDIPIDGGMIDCAYCMFVFEHFPEKEVGRALLHEVQRVLVPGGIFLLRIATTETGWSPPRPSSFAGVTWALEEIKQLFLDAGLEIIHLSSEPHQTPDYTFRSIIGRKECFTSSYPNTDSAIRPTPASFRSRKPSTGIAGS